jgi:hypothetical protein
LLQIFPSSHLPQNLRPLLILLIAPIYTTYNKGHSVESCLHACKHSGLCAQDTLIHLTPSAVKNGNHSI